MGDRLAIRNSKSASNLKTSDLKSEIPRATNTSSGVARTERQKGEESEQISMAQRSPKVLVHPINVGQGDAILLEIRSTDGQSEKHLIDGGYGQKGETRYYYENLKRSLRAGQCLVKKQVRMDSIIVTHPDQDHCGGINRMLQDFTITAPITTTLASCLKVNGSDIQLGEVFLSDERDQIRHCFPLTGEGENGRRHACTNIEQLSKGSTVIVAKNESVRFKETETEEELSEEQSKKKFNATSILTTVQLQQSTYDYDVVLTGDSYCTIIDKKLVLKDKSVGVFQVPHHGSRYNLDDKGIKGINRSTAQEFKKFYSSFDAYIYLISHGKRYKHPHSEVITGILLAAVQKKRDRKCKIVVTATWFEEREIDEISNWREYVDIFYFKKDVPYVTLDPNDEQLSKGLQLLVKKVSDDGHDDDTLQATLSLTSVGATEKTPEQKRERPHSANGRVRKRLQYGVHSDTSDASVHSDTSEKSCRICNKPENPTDKWYKCTNRRCPKIHTSCEEDLRSRRTYIFTKNFEKCVYCRTCKECNDIMGTVHASCHLCGGAGHKRCVPKKTRRDGYTCRICKRTKLVVQ